MRVCAWMYLFKNYALKDRIGFAKVYGMPLRVSKYEPGESRADRDALIRAVRTLGSDAAGIISKPTEIEFIEARKGSSQDRRGRRVQPSF
jgi:phage gp29-like protein